MRGDTNFKGSDSSDPTVYSLYCDLVFWPDKDLKTFNNIAMFESFYSLNY